MGITAIDVSNPEYFVWALRTKMLKGLGSGVSEIRVAHDKEACCVIFVATIGTRYEPYGATASGTAPTGIGCTAHVSMRLAQIRFVLAGQVDSQFEA
jgi:hypothetical protein